MTECTSGGYDQLDTSAETIEQELRPAICERGQTDRLMDNYSIDGCTCYTSIIQRDPLFANDLVICEESRLEVEQLDSWREVLEGNGLRISRKETVYLSPAGSSEEVCLAGEPAAILCTNTFKNLEKLPNGWTDWHHIWYTSAH